MLLSCIGFAQDNSKANNPSNQRDYYQEIIQQVLDSEDFNEQKTVKAWRLKEKFLNNDEDEASSTPQWLINFIEFLESITESFNKLPAILEVILWVIGISIVVYLLTRYRHNISSFFSNINAGESPPLPTEMFGLDIRRESLPDDIIKAANELWQGNDQRASISLLLRGTLSRLIHEDMCQFQAGDTELECLSKVSAIGDQRLTQFMQRLTTVWQQLAYAHQTPNKVDFELLCQNWQEVFDAR